ncbi:MAG: DUF6270 domain-containing protein [Brachybacterium sp.]
MPAELDDANVVHVAVYGSCVARDSVDLAGHGRLEVVDYVARQSLLSADHDSIEHFPKGTEIPSPFQRRQMESDFRGDLRARLADAAEGIDILLWDLADERHGVHVFEDGGVATRSIDVINMPDVLEVVDAGRHIPFGTDEHFDLWTKSVESLTEALVEMKLFERTLVLQVPWALLTVDGKPTPWSMGRNAREANELYRRYYALLRELGYKVLELFPLGVLADPEHRWGLAPFHYTQDVYEQIVGMILEECNSGARRADPSE